jgi:hypothetical protein
MDLDIQQEGYPDHGAANAPAPDLQDQQRQPGEQRDEDDPAAQELQRVAGQVGLPDDLVQRSAHDHRGVDRSCGTLSHVLPERAGRRGERSPEPPPGRRAASRASRGERNPRPSRLGLPPLGRAWLLLGRLEEARNLGNRAVEANQFQPGFAAHALHLLGDIATHPDQFDADVGELITARRCPSPSHAACAHSSPTATSVAARSIDALASGMRRMGTSPPRRRCTARWTCASGWSRRRWCWEIGRRDNRASSAGAAPYPLTS